MPSIEGAAAFWSYSHLDDESDDGNILRLASLISNEFSLITGSDLEIFVDRTSIKWGQEWRRRIDEALAATTLFIPILTPRYFAREECRREAIQFHGAARSLGTEELLLPILYLPVPGLEESNEDEVVSLLSRYQYIDWTDHRLSEHSSGQHRRAVNEVARHLAAASQAAAKRKLSGEIAATERTDDDQMGGLELVDKVGALMPEWVEAVEGTVVNQVQSTATFDYFSGRIAKYERSRVHGGPYLSVLRRLAQEQMPMAERYKRDAVQYTRASLDLDPLVRQLLRLARDYPDVLDGASEFRRNLEKVRTAIRRGERQDVDRSLILAEEWARQRAHHSRLLRQLADTFAEGSRAAEEGNRIAEAWLLMLDEMTTPRNLNDGAASITNDAY
ncbi:TIR domain-containing protein [Actinoplanes sp. NPDC004185]